MDLKEVVKLRIEKMISQENNFLSEILDVFDGVSTSELIFLLHVLYEKTVDVESWRLFLVDVLELDESKKVVIHYPVLLDTDTDNVYHIVCNDLEHCKRVLNYFNFEGWIKEVRLKIDKFSDCQYVVDYILETPNFSDVTINLYTDSEVTGPYISDPRITIT